MSSSLKKSYSTIATKVIIVSITCLSCIGLKAQVPLSYFLPDIEYDTSLLRPSEYLKFEIGEFHITHGQLVHYLEKICSQSPNCRLEEYARSHESKPLINLVISSEKNINNLDELRQKHNQLLDAKISGGLKLEEIPLVLYQGYSIHGNESSGANASMLIAYYLLAGKSAKIDRLLDNTIILLDPCYNPDGLQRFSTWVNSNRHKRLNSDPVDREFDEPWPGGRTNHYWFDLNRDWLFTVHPESQGRIKQFHRWKPDILTDHHEMGSNSTFFFQPGVPSRTNPNTPQLNQDLTEEIAQFHASFLDSIGSLYFTKQRFDDYYYGKGSTYPDINGCIGILFEQASSRGHLKETSNGLLSFPFTIRNQLVTSLSTQEAAAVLKNDLLEFKRNFYKKSMEVDPSSYFIFEAEDHFLYNSFSELLRRHDIRIYKNDKARKLDGQNFSAEHSVIVPLHQAQSGLIKTIFETVHEFRDSIFYDVSSWTIPLALGLKSSYASSGLDEDLSKLEPYEKKHEILDLHLENKLALMLDWSQFNAPAFINQCLEEGIRVLISKKSQTLGRAGQKIIVDPGDLVIPLVQDGLDKNALGNLIIDIANKWNLKLIAIERGAGPKLEDSLGSSEFAAAKKVKIAMIAGEGINAYEAGDTWHLLDWRFQIPLTLIDVSDVSRVNLDRYTHIILPDGDYSSIDLKVLENWLKSGGIIISMRRSIRSLINNKWLDSLVEVSNQDLLLDEETGDLESLASRGSHIIGGAIFNIEAKADHPLTFGYETDKFSIFKRGTQFYRSQSDAVLRYSDNPVASGYVSDLNRQKAKGSGVLYCAAYGRGRIVACVDNPNFRGYWLSGSKLFANMIYMTPLVPYSQLMK